MIFHQAKVGQFWDDFTSKFGYLKSYVIFLLEDDVCHLVFFWISKNALHEAISLVVPCFTRLPAGRSWLEPIIQLISKLCCRLLISIYESTPQDVTVTFLVYPLCSTAQAPSPHNVSIGSPFLVCEHSRLHSSGKTSDFPSPASSRTKHIHLRRSPRAGDMSKLQFEQRITTVHCDSIRQK